MYDSVSQQVHSPTFNPSRYTGKERDQESGLDYFGARYYVSNMGRWMSPDWADKPEAVPYSELHSPQTLNLYSYVRNNSMNSIDVAGHVGEHGDTWDQFDANVASAHGIDDATLNAVFGSNSPQGQKLLGQLTGIIFNETSSFLPMPDAAENQPGSTRRLREKLG